jgi:hypothetical protein
VVDRYVALGYVVRRSVCGTVYLSRTADRALGTGGLHVREVGLRADVALAVEVVEVHLVIVVVPARSYPRPVAKEGRMEQRSVGCQGLRVSAIGLGCMVMSKSYWPADERESVATIQRAFDLGITFLVTADM